MSNPYGFDWGPMSVERMCHIEGRGYVLNIQTDHREMQVFISEKGRKIEPYPVRVSSSTARRQGPA